MAMATLGNHGLLEFALPSQRSWSPLLEVRAARIGAVKNIVLVHGTHEDGSAWRGVYDILKNDGRHVSVDHHGSRHRSEGANAGLCSGNAARRA